MSKQQIDILNRYHSLRAEAKQEIRQGQMRAALDRLEQALELAKDLERQDLIDRAVCNLSRVEIELGPTRELLGALGKVLLRSRDSETCFLASYNLVRAHLLRRDSEKALFYGKIAEKYAKKANQPELEADALNGVGLAQLSSSYFPEAQSSFEEALALLAPTAHFRRAVLLDNLGYCQIVQGRYEEAFQALFESLRTLVRSKEKWFEKITRISICFAYLEIGKFRSAVRHGLVALHSAQEMKDSSTEKSALFLLGEACKLNGDTFGARRYFDRLQEVFYPDADYLPDMLMVVDARSMVNLKA